MNLRVFLVVTLMLAGCSGAASVETTDRPSPTTSAPAAPTTATTATPSTSTVLPEPTEAEPVIPEVLAEFAIETIHLDGAPLLVAIADTGVLRRQGLMNVEDTGDLDGMLFVFDSDSSSGFWMKNTLIPLDIAFFDADGRYVDGFAMEPCTTATCPTYHPSGSYRFALEMPAGQMPGDVETLTR